jgi:hypothetical protein
MKNASSCSVIDEARKMLAVIGVSVRGQF